MLYINELETALASVVNGEEIVYEKHIGCNFYIYIKSPFECFQIRQKYMKDGELRYSKYNGISLKQDQFKSFTLLTVVIESFHPQIAEAVLCSQKPDHTDWMEGEVYIATCRECNPFKC